MTLQGVWNDVKSQLSSPEDRAALEKVEDLVLEALKAVVLAQVGAIPVLGPLLKPVAGVFLEAQITKVEHVTDDFLKGLAPVPVQFGETRAQIRLEPLTAEPTGAKDTVADWPGGQD